MVMLTPKSEVDFRRRWYEAHLHHFEQDSKAVERQKSIQGRLREGAAAALAIRDTLRETGDLKAFIDSLQGWSIQFAKSFNNFGQMFMNQVVNYSIESEQATEVLADVLWPPATHQESLSKIKGMADYVEGIKSKGQPAPRRVPFVLSFFWSLAERARWPVMWASAARFAEFSTGHALPQDPSDRYQAYLGLVNELDDDYERFERVAAWWDREKPLIVDPVLLDRSRFGWAWDNNRVDEIRQNAQVLVGISKYWGKVLKSDLEKLLGPDFVPASPPLEWAKDRPRSDLYVRFGPGSITPNLRIGVDQDGLCVGVGSGLGSKGWVKHAAEMMLDMSVEGCELISTRRSTMKTDHEFGMRPDQVMYGRHWSKNRLPGDLRAVVTQTASRLRDCLAELAEQYVAFDGPESPKPTNGGGETGPGGLAVSLDKLAEELLIKRDFLDEIEKLLNDKGQVVFYGPPGTGKTYLAKKLAEYLAPNSGQRAFVQFHPSMSYEDFFEGYRPYTSGDGSMTYRLTSGPLRTIAGRAAEDPEKLHIMIIDEFNRANLPRVLGELLFLLEYRKETVLPLYRPDEPFQLPKNLWLIGTMNTADRSIALVDAALRRRFHFVPFFPHHGLVEGLLERWLDKKRESPWVGKLVAEVNKKLTEALGGPHLQLGHTHFIKEGISDLKTGMFEMVWKYTVEPFIEEQFFDDPNRIESFRFGRVLRDHGPSEDGFPEGDQTAHGE